MTAPRVPQAPLTGDLRAGQAGRAAGSVLRALFVAYLIATAIHIAFVVAHEPFAFDDWNIARDTGAAPFSLARWLGYGAYEYTHSNPRIGQWLEYLAYKVVGFEAVATPLAFLALSAAVATLGLGRLPSWRRGRDLALWSVALGALWFALPRIAMTLFARAYCTNYVYGAVIQLWFVVAIWLGRARGGYWRAAVYAALGVAAGMANEHTGPVLVAFAIGCAALRQRRPPVSVSAPVSAADSAADSAPDTAPGSSSVRALWAGAAGAVIGFGAIFFAPGQDQRYDGLATRISLVGRFLRRGVTDNFDIYCDFVIGCAPVLALIAVALALEAWRPAIASPAAPGASPPAPGASWSSPGTSADDPADARRRALRFFGAVAIAGTLITATVFVSPRLGPRFYLHSCALVLAALIAVLDAVATPKRLAAFAALAVCSSAYAAAHTVPLYRRVGAQSDARQAELRTAARGSTPTVEAFDQSEPSWWFVGDELRDVLLRRDVAAFFGLRAITYRALDTDAPLGVSDVRLVPRYQIEPESCLDDHGGLDLPDYRGLDVATIQAAMQLAIERLRARLGTAGQLDRLDLAVEFSGAAPALPRPTLWIGRWQPSGLTAYAGSIERRGRSLVRDVRIPDALRSTDREIYIYRVGGEARRLGAARDASVSYEPWTRGAYWALACSPDDCFVIAAARAL